MSRTDTPRRGRVVLITLAIAALTLTVGTACAKSKTGNGADPDANQGLTNVGKTPGTNDPSTGDDGSGGGSGGGTSASASPSNKPGGATKSPAKGPVINAFSVVGKASCGSAGGPGIQPVSGRVTLIWSVTGTNMVGVSIDDPNFGKSNGGSGSWRNYPATFQTDNDDVPFSCDGAAGNRTHTYTLSTIGGGAIATKTITLTAFWEGPPNP